jgi:transcriptional regulator with XRE-family HTH domain
LSIKNKKYIDIHIKMDLERFVIDNIKRIRKERGISQEKLAEACDTATSYIGLMEIYRNVPKLSTISKIADALDVSPLAIFQPGSPIPEEKEAELLRKKSRILAVLDKQIEQILRENP